MANEAAATIEDLAQLIADRVRPAVPIEVALWDTKDVASYLRKSESVVRERVACLPDFPVPVRLPSLRPGGADAAKRRGHPLWKAIEVIRWAESFKGDKSRAGRPRKN